MSRNPINKELVAASAEPMVLSLLEHGENYGYAIIKEIERRSGGKIAWTEGMLYPVLHRLERGGKIKARWKTADNGRSEVFSSPRAVSALSEIREQWSSSEPRSLGIPVMHVSNYGSG